MLFRAYRCWLFSWHTPLRCYSSPSSLRHSPAQSLFSSICWYFVCGFATCEHALQLLAACRRAGLSPMRPTRRKTEEMLMASTLGGGGAGNAKHLSLQEPTIAKPAAGRSCITSITDRALMSQSCIPKMDHHCPWTSNCVSHFTFPHFIRFIFYAVAAMTYLEYFLFIRCAVLWNKRDQTSVSQFTHISI